MDSTESALRVAYVQRREDYRIALKHEREAAKRPGTSENVHALRGAQAWTDLCQERMETAGARLLTYIFVQS